MKNLLVLALFFVTTVCSAQIELEGNKEGVYRVKEDVQEWAPSKITAEPEAINYIDKFSQAINSPGTPILVGESSKTLKLKPVLKKLVEIEEKFIVYKEAGDNIRFFVNVETREAPSYLILFSIASILLMIISNILFKRGYNNDAATFAAAVAVFVFVFAAVAVFAFAAFAVFAAVFAAAAFAVFAAVATNKNYKVASIIFYILMVIHIVLLFV